MGARRVVHHRRGRWRLGGVVSTRTHQMCQHYQRGMPVSEIATKFGVQNPAVWKALRRGGIIAPYKAKKAGGPGRPIGGGLPGYTEKRLAKSAAYISAKESREPPRPLVVVDRTPCPRCGVRGDIGCSHQGAAA